MNQPNLKEFIDFTRLLKGDEKGEAQLFCDRLFRAFGHGGIIEANGTLEARIKFSTGGTKFADCLWSPLDRPGVLIEMKRRSEKNLEKHFPQVRDYWIEMNPETVIGPKAQKPEFIILCNFDRFIIYRYLTRVDDLDLVDLISRQSAFNFLLPQGKEPIFHHNVEVISKDAAKLIGELFKYLIFEKKHDRAKTQHYILQCVMALFAEDFCLLPPFFFAELVRLSQKGGNSYDLIGGLFRQMASPKPAAAGIYKDVPYFNGGLFKEVDPIELDTYSLGLLEQAANYNWKEVNPAIFGALFESTMNAEERHAFGAHFTSEADILKIVSPTIIKPWKDKIEKADTLESLSKLLDQIGKFRILDPACGCGNFLFVAYRALKDIEMQIIEKIASKFTRTKKLSLGISRVTTSQFFGIDVQPIAVEVAKMTMMLAKELAADDWNNRISPMLKTLGLITDQGLPLDSLDENILCQDAILEDWPKFDVVIGNPPYQSKNKIKQEMDNAYIGRIRQRYPEIPGNADFCVYWFRKAHDLLKKGQRAGLVGTNTIRQNYSRIGGLDYIIANGGTITDAVSTQVWSGDAVVHVSIVNWVKGPDKSEKLLVFQKGDNLNDPFEYFHPKFINSSLSLRVDVTSAKPLLINQFSKCCYQGQTHGHEGFLLSKEDAEAILAKHPKHSEVLFPFLIGNELLGNKDSLPERYVIDFRNKDLFAASAYSDLFSIVKAKVFPDREAAYNAEKSKNDLLLQTNPKAKVNHHHANFFKSWWQLSYDRNELMTELSSIQKYLVCSRVTKRPIFEFVSSAIHPNDALQVFPVEDDYSFGIFQSSINWLWFQARCSTMKADPRYTSNTVFDSFPWPQSPTKSDIAKIAKLAKELRLKRREIMSRENLSLRDLYRLIETTPNNPVSDIQNQLDLAVKAAYGMSKKDNVLQFLLDLNLKLYADEQAGKAIVGPGLPSFISDPAKYVSDDCISIK